MLIKDVCKVCGLTKKAIEYYEKQGLVSPKVLENGYRNYTNVDISILQEISVLRRLGLGVDDIKDVLSSTNKSVTLSKYKYLIDLKMEKAAMQQKCLENLIANYDISEEIKFIDVNINCLFTIKEKLVQSFPGTYGMYLSIHFGKFLNERIDSKEKEEAYSKIINFLDNVNVPKEVEEYLESYFTMIEKTDMEKMDDYLLSAIEDMDNYIIYNKEMMEGYMEICNSKEYKESAAYKFQKLLSDFQKTNGYYDIFIPNLKVLSNSYREYVDKLQEANKIFMEKYPEMTNLYQRE